MKSVRGLVGVLLVSGASVVGFGVIGLSGQSAAGTTGRAADTDALPKDINTESRSRLAPITKDQVAARLKNEWDAAAARSASGKPEGAAYLRLHRTGVDVRWDAHAGRRLSELSIISTAREHDQPYEWSLHHMEALSVGSSRRSSTSSTIENAHRTGRRASLFRCPRVRPTSRA